MANQAIRVFIDSPLPGMIGRGEVAGHGEELLQGLVAMEFGAVIEGDRLEHAAMLTNRLDAHPGDFLRGPRLHFLDDHQARLPLYKGNYAMMPVASDHGIPFPVPELLARLYSGRAGGDMAFPG